MGNNVKEYKIEGYLYLPLGMTRREAENVVYSRFEGANILSVDVKATEIAVDFDVIVEGSTQKSVEAEYLKKLQGLNLDNYIIGEK